MRPLPFLSILLLLLPLAGAAAQLHPTHPDADVHFERSSLAIDTGEERHRFEVELAVNRAQLMRGLMHRRSLPADHGMLFLYVPPRRAGIWMRNTYIPLDIIFIRPDGTIESIHEGARPHDESVMASRGAVGAVLEVNAGVVRLLGIEPGDVVRHPVFGTAP